MKITGQQEAIRQVKQYVGTSHAGYIHNKAIEDDHYFLVLVEAEGAYPYLCLLCTSPSPRDGLLSRMPSSA